MRKMASVLLIMTLLLSVLAACSSGKSNEGSANASPSIGGKENKPSKEIPTLKVMVQNHPAFPFNKDWLVWKIIEQHTGVKLEPSPIVGNWWESIPLIVASGDMPDFLWMSGYPTVHKYGKEGALVNLLDNLKQMPNLEKWLKTHPESAVDGLSDEGKMYVLPNEGGYSSVNAFWMYREDIFKKHNLQVPKTFDELYTVSKKLKELYPESFPISFSKGTGPLLGMMAAAFETSTGYYFNEKKKQWLFGPSEDNYKTMLEYVNKLYKEKLIPTEFLTLDPKQRDEMITKDKAFFNIGYVNNIDTYQNNVRKENPNFTLAFMPPPKGSTGIADQGGQSGILPEGLTLTSTTKNKEAALRVIDWLYTDEARVALSWGVEGETFTTTNGVKKFKDTISDIASLRKNYGIGTAGTVFWMDYSSTVALMTPDSKKAYAEAEKYATKGTQTAPFSKEEQEVISLKGVAVGKYSDENVSKFIVGNRPLTEWNDYVAGYSKLGISDMLKVYKDATDRFNKNKK